jgi:hypothetical protein
MACELLTLAMGEATPWRAIKVALQSEKSRNGLQNPLGKLFHQGHATAQVDVCFKRNNLCFAGRLPWGLKKLRTAACKKSGDLDFRGGTDAEARSSAWGR